MIGIKIITGVLDWLGGGVLKSILGHLEKRKELELGSQKLQTDITIEEIKAEQARRLAQRDVLIAETSSGWLALPRWLFGISGAGYFMAHCIDAIWQLPGDIAPLPAEMVAILMTIVSGLFLEKVANDVAAKITRKK